MDFPASVLNVIAMKHETTFLMTYTTACLELMLNF